MQPVKTSLLVLSGLLFLPGCASTQDATANDILENKLPGTAMLTGEVTAPKAFQAAKVYARNTDKNIIYMVYTGGGRYQTVALFPGPYEVWVEKTGFESDRQEIQVEVGDVLNVDFSLREATPRSAGQGSFLGRNMGDRTKEAPFWLSSGGSIVTAQARFTVPEHGFYSIEARYLSSTPVRWVSNGCLKIVTCELSGERGMLWKKVVVLELDAGEQDLEITLPPDASLDQVVIQRRDPSIEAYIRVAAEEGFRIGPANQVVRRREAVAAALRLSNRFDGRAQFGCEDSLIAMEQSAFLRLAALRNEPEEGDGFTFGLPIPDAAATGAGASLFPKGNFGPVASPVVPVATPIGQPVSE